MDYRDDPLWKRADEIARQQERARGQGMAPSPTMMRILHEQLDAVNAERQARAAEAA